MDVIGDFASTRVDVVIAVVVGYLLGSIPIANLVAARRSAIDLRNVGDRNPGFWNARETMGRRAAVPVFVGDVAKGSPRPASEHSSPMTACGDSRTWPAVPQWSATRFRSSLDSSGVAAS